MDVVSRLRDMENKLESVSFALKNEKTLFFGGADSPTDGDEFSFDITALTDCHVEINVSFDYLYDLCDDVIVKMNGVTKLVSKATVGRNYLEFDCKTKEGNNELSIVFNRGGNAVGLSVKAKGIVEKKDRGSRADSLELGNRRFYSLFNGAKKNAMIFYNDGDSDRVVFFEDCERFAMTKFSQTELVAIYGDGRDMNGVVLGSDGTVVTELSFYADAECFCGGKGNGGALFYAAEGGAIKAYFFDGGLNLTVSDTGKKGREVFSSADEDGFIVIGFDGKCDFVVG